MKSSTTLAIFFLVIISLTRVTGCRRRNHVKKGKAPIIHTRNGNSRDLDQELKNKKLVVTFYEQVFRDRNLIGIEKFLAPDYIQHNPFVADGRDAFLDWLKGTFPPGIKPSSRFIIERVVAEGDWVWLHLLSNLSPNSNPSADCAVVDIFRVKDGVLVEHFDVSQELPYWSSNSHPFLQFLANDYEPECGFARQLKPKSKQNLCSSDHSFPQC